MTTLHSRIGFEVELMAPRGSSRRTLADRLADDHDGHVTRFFHTDSEPSLVPGMGHFWHLTPGYAVSDCLGRPVAELVDDVTLVDDLRRDHEEARVGPSPDTRPADADRSDGHPYRVLSDDPRLLRLVARHSSPDAPFDHALDEAAALFGSTVETVGAVRRLRDGAGSSIALASALAAGRERPCEIVTPPVVADHEATLERLLGPARQLGFTVPVEAAVHLHVDGAPFRSVTAFANLVRLFSWWRDPLRAVLATNPACTRLAPLPSAVVELVDRADRGDGGRARDWSQLQADAAGTGLTKYADVNLTALVTDRPVRDTIEIRILPGTLDAAELTESAGLVERLLARCLETEPVPRPTSSDARAAAAGLLDLARSGDPARLVLSAEATSAGRR
ncbi:amidoligase family protein [Frigoribacterium sp. VKM Ac-2836]|uniref:amidoligase family protein n=1 Tax=Frigoribacterium sp. VKM Ac-2836 TaxID=2739014 RepID=UPI0015651E4F|nr:amidoligase family protein [Frigoribacterium sp. VKM Ac-2836]NRD26579.1 amidoligase family protein [Frigoribacterium sp. VKM Ac-2836]